MGGERPARARVLVGLMSGTSGDGIDAVALRVPAGFVESERGTGERPAVLSHHHEAFDEGVRRRVLGAGGRPAAELALLHAEFGRRFAEAAIAAMRAASLAPSDVSAIATAGLTVAHLPPGSPAPADADGQAAASGATLALGDGDVIAELTGCTVVCDLRARDRAAGGHGAPLVPFADALLLRAPDATVAALNLGGIANVTLVAPTGAPVAFDVGPGNMVLDGAVARATGGGRRMDRDGGLARAGAVDRAWLEELLAGDEFLVTPPPRSTGRERYGEAFLQRHARRLDALSLPDALATLTAYVAEGVAIALERHAPRRPAHVVVSGGGAHNGALMDAIARRLDPVGVRDSGAALGIPPLAKEAAAMALIGAASLSRVAGNVPSVTGAARPCILGKLCLPPLAPRAPG